MKKCLMILGLVATASAFGQTTSDAHVVEVYANVKEVGYTKAIQGGTVTLGKEWEGTRILKLKDGRCIQVERVDLKIVAHGDAQRPEFKETKSPVACPKAAGTAS